jgi:hypothetical protein
VDAAGRPPDSGEKTCKCRQHDGRNLNAALGEAWQRRTNERAARGSHHRNRNRIPPSLSALLGAICLPARCAPLRLHDPIADVATGAC